MRPSHAESLALIDAVEDLLEYVDENELDLSVCPYFRAQHQLPGADLEGMHGPSTCMGGCVDEPACVTSEPALGWPLMRLRELLQRMEQR